MLRFDMANAVATIDGLHLKAIPAFATLYKILDPDQRDRVFTYIHIVSRVDSKAPFFTAVSEELPHLAKRQYFDNAHPFPDDLMTVIDDALQAYIKAYEKPEDRVLKLFNDKIDQISNTIKTTSPEIKTNNSGTFTSNIDIIVKSMEKIDSLLVTKDRLEAKIRNESESKGSVRGKKAPSRLERKTMMRKNG